MLWKELRENLKWAVLAMIGLAMAEFYALNQQQFFGFYVEGTAPLCKSSFLMITTFGNAAVGLVLGLVQILPEQRRDQWAALIHRPVSRATLFRGKAVAGFLLYLAAAILPFAACVWYAATPNHFDAPFTPRMIYPGVADICAGALYYFAALFVALRRGPWYGTRAFGFLAAVAGSFIVTAYYVPFYLVIEATVYLSLALFTAAWGAMLSNGTLRAQPWLARLAVVAVVFYGVTTLGAIADLIWSAFQPQEYYFGLQYIIDIDGRPLELERNREGHTKFTDLAGNPVDDPRLKTGLSGRNMINLSELTGYIGNNHGQTNRTTFDFGYRRSETYLETLYVYGQVSGEAWYYLPRERVFAGYNVYNRIRVGGIGQNGFVPGGGRVEPFHGRLEGNRNGQITSVVQFGSSVYYLDFGQRTLGTVFSQPGTEVFGSTSISPNDDEQSQRTLVAAALLDRAELLDNKGTLLSTMPYHYDMDRWGSLQLGAKSVKGPYYLEYLPSDWIDWNTRRKMPSYLEELDGSGKVLKSYTLPALEQAGSPRSWQQYVGESLETPAFFYGELLYDKIGQEVGSKRLTQKWNERIGDGWGYTREISLRITTLSILLAVVALGWARYRQFSWNRSWAWAAFVFAFNLAGLITFRLVADWPVLVKCPACGRPRLVNEETCPHCQAGWPAPVHDGTEIIEPTPALVTVGE